MLGIGIGTRLSACAISVLTSTADDYAVRVFTPTVRACGTAGAGVLGLVCSATIGDG
jgi:hypothetical protein